MALFVKNPEVDELAGLLAAIRKVSKTEAVRQALEHELERVGARPSLVQQGVDFCRALRARGNPERAQPADRAFIDSLYEGD